MIISVSHYTLNYKMIYLYTYVTYNIIWNPLTLYNYTPRPRVQFYFQNYKHIRYTMYFTNLTTVFLKHSIRRSNSHDDDPSHTHHKQNHFYCPEAKSFYVHEIHFWKFNRDWHERWLDIYNIRAKKIMENGKFSRTILRLNLRIFFDIIFFCSLKIFTWKKN